MAQRLKGSRRINTTYNSDGGFLQSNILVKLFITYHPHYGGEFGISMRQFPKASLGSFGASEDAPIMTPCRMERNTAECILHCLRSATEKITNSMTRNVPRERWISYNGRVCSTESRVRLDEQHSISLLCTATLILPSTSSHNKQK